LQTGLAYAKLRAVQGEATKDTKGYADAIAIAQQIRASSPNRVEALLDLSLYQLASGDIAAAVATSMQASDLVPTVAYPKWVLGNAYAKAGSLLEAGLWMESALEDPDFAARVYSQGSQIQRLGDVYANEGEWAKLAVLYQKVLELHPDRAEIWGALALADEQLGAYDAGIAAAKEAMRLEPQFTEPATALIKSLERAKKKGGR
jgi:tetratricopeptide (TPR) repeat protein